MRANHWQDWVNLFLAGWLFITPWFYGFTGLPGAAWNAWIVAVLVAVFAVAALARFAQWQEWANIVLGVWLAISPWVVGGATAPAIRWNFVLVGLAIAVIAAWNLAMHRPMLPGPTRTA